MSNFYLKLKTIPSKGRIVYEYNPLYNLRLKEDNGTLKKNQLYNLDTTNSEDGLNFDLTHPVDITCQNSYDGSVNLILNDGKNAPKLINTRFSVRENNTYEVIDREGNNDTNIYDEASFESDTSLFKKVNKIPTIKLHEINNSGNLKVGNYVFYIKYADADGNETDFVAESGLVSCFIGSNASPFQIQGGYRDQNSNKAVTFKVSNIDKQYDYIKICYTRATSDIDENVVTTAYEIIQTYPIITTISYITITGNEAAQPIPLSDINQQYFIASSVKAQAQCQNRLFFGNVTQSTPENKELKDLSLRIYPTYSKYTDSKLIGSLTGNYLDGTSVKNKYAYYNVHNIYNYVGYWPEEIYRFGIVYILKDGSLSPVYNTLGITGELTTEYPADYWSSGGILPLTTNSGERYYLPVDEGDFSVNNNTTLNAKGVVKFPQFSSGENGISNNDVISINFYIPTAIAEELKKYVKGYFFVRQKRIPTILCQGMTLNVDQEANVPMLPNNKIESFLSSSRTLVHSRDTRLKEGVPTEDTSACICPEYDTNEAGLNQVFTGNDFYIKRIGKLEQGSGGFARLYDCTNYTAATTHTSTTAPVVAVQDSAPVIITHDMKFRARCGEETDATKFRYIGKENKTSKADNLVRGLYGNYLGIGNKFEPGSLINIYIPGYDYSKIFSRYYKERYEDNSQYYTISDRFIFDTYNTDKSHECFRGDSYICTFTHRLNRNFQDPSAPTNDIIINSKSWSSNYDVDDSTKNAKINRGDVNAIKMGTWFTVKVRSSRNLGLRTVDLSYPSEEGMFGHPRGFYPLQGLDIEGSGKIPESHAFNAGFGITVGERWHYTLPYVPTIKNCFQTRIYYSEIAINDAFKNGYRVFKDNSYTDYSFDHGAITKLIELNGGLVCVFEHGVSYIPVKERAIVSNENGASVFINTNNILPDNPIIISDTFGSQWPESIIKTPYGIYGIDTVAKKIWKTDGRTLNCISDLRVSRFLNENISLGEFEMTPIIGIRNVKTHYNAFKHDVMFTFYDNTKGLHETAWNLCYNEVQDKFITFYSWLPSFSDNINNIYFTFDRDTSKIFTKLSSSKTGSNEASGVSVEKTDISNWNYIEIEGIKVYYSALSLYNVNLPELTGTAYLDYDYSFADCVWLSNTPSPTNYRSKDGRIEFNISYVIGTGENVQFSTKYDGQNNLIADAYPVLTITETHKNNLEDGELLNLKLKCAVKVINNYINQTTNYDTYENTLYLVNDYTKLQNSTYFWKHGQAGIFDISDKIKPTTWYGKVHPFEFECIVTTDNPSVQKIFQNLQILSNRAEPESFHYEVVGESYDWAKDKANMYYRQEATKCLYQTLGSNITYDYKYLADSTNVPKQSFKSTLFPLTYVRQDKYDEINDTYVFDNYKFLNEVYLSWKEALSTHGYAHDYEHLSGSEIVYDSLLDEYKVQCHAKGLNIKTVGRLRGNMDYKEDCWDIQINSIIFVEKNEKPWIKKLPPISLVGGLPNDIYTTNFSDNTLKNTEISDYDTTMVDLTSWGNRKETRLRDKYIRIRVRYSGKDLAVINSLSTLYTISYA